MFKDFKVKSGEYMLETFGEKFVDANQHNINVKELKIKELEEKKKVLEAELESFKAAKEQIEEIQPAPVEVPINVEEPKPVEQVQPTPVVEEPAKEVEVKPVDKTEEIQSLEKNIESAQATLEVAKKEAAEKEILRVGKEKLIQFFKDLNNSFSSTQILDTIIYISENEKELTDIPTIDTIKLKELDMVKDKDNTIKIITNSIDKVSKTLPLYSLVKLPIDFKGMITRIETAQTLEQFLNIMVAIKETIIEAVSPDDIELAIAKYNWTDEEVAVMGETKESLAKKVQEIESKLANEKTAIELEAPILVEEGISRLMFAYPGALRAEHNHLSPTNNVFTAQNSSGQQLTIVPLLDDNKQLTRVKIALSPIELFQDGTVVPFTFASQHHEQDFVFNAKVMAAITSFITNNGGFRTNTNDTSIELEDVKK